MCSEQVTEYLKGTCILLGLYYTSTLVLSNLDPNWKAGKNLAKKFYKENAY